jgi:hypothetical protein
MVSFSRNGTQDVGRFLTGERVIQTTVFYRSSKTEMLARTAIESGFYTYAQFTSFRQCSTKENNNSLKEKHRSGLSNLIYKIIHYVYFFFNKYLQNTLDNRTIINKKPNTTMNLKMLFEPVFSLFS